MARTEGWPTGVRLAALALANSADHAEALAHFAEDDHTVADYLVGEILRGLPDDMLGFLLATSVCDRFSPALAAALTGRGDAGDVIDTLERGNVLLTRCGSGRPLFRYHELLQAHLRATLRRTRPDEIDRLHRVAARWFAEHDEPLTALRHAAEVTDPDLVGDLLATQGTIALVTGQTGALRELADRLPAAVTARPVAALVLALADLDHGDVAAADARLRCHDPADATRVDRRLGVLRGVAEVHRARWMGGLEPAIQRLARSRPDAVTDRDVAALGIATQGEGLFCLGRHDLAEPELDRALAIAAAGHRDYLGLRCRTHLAAVSLARSDYAQTRRRANEAVRFAAEHGFARHPASAYPYALAGWAAYQSLDTDMAQRCATLSAALLPRRAEPSVELLVRSLGAVLASTHGEGPYDALVTLRGHWTRRGQDAAVHPSLVALSSTAEVRMALRLGELAWAGEAVRRARDQLDDSGDALLSRAMVLAHRGCTAAARAALEKITHGEVASHLAASVVEANLLFAVLAAHGREHNAAHAAVLAALDIAAGTRALRPFLDGRDSVRRLLVASVGRFGRLDGFVEDVLTRIPVEPNAMVGALTPREHELLAELPSMRTTDEIAEGLYLSVNTVKTHLRSVYRKLGVSSRREAILAARTLGLL